LSGVFTLNAIKIDTLGSSGKLDDDGIGCLNKRLFYRNFLNSIGSPYVKGCKKDDYFDM